MKIDKPEQKLTALIPHLPDEPRVRNSSERLDPNANKHERVASHLGRLAKLMARDEIVEARVWESAVNELLIKPEDIPDKYWRQQQQILRDHGYGTVGIDGYQKRTMAEKLQEDQRSGANTWANYFETTGEQYPLWFKFYAWDGMSKLGTFNKEKGVYNKRKKDTVAPYPHLNPAVLAKVYDTLNTHFDGVQPDDEELRSLTKGSFTFNQIYSHILLEQKAIIPTPERPEDVMGEWRHYTNAEVSALAAAAEGTSWCIAGESTANSYTSNGGEFYLFHLMDPEAAAVSPTACASIRTGDDGHVAEISGLLGGSEQRLEDALVPTVKQKLAELPGGERYMQAFQDKQKLITMDKKFQAGEQFTPEEIEFLFEFNRSIEHVRTNDDDPRIKEFKAYVLETVETLPVAIGIDDLVATLDSNEIADNLDKLLAAGATIDVNDLVAKLKWSSITKNLDRLLAASATIDVDALVAKLSSYEIADNLDKLLAAGATIDVNNLIPKLSTDTVADNLDRFIAADAYADLIVDNLDPEIIVKNFDKLIAAGASPYTIQKRLRSSNIFDKLDRFPAAGVAIDTLVARLHYRDIIYNLDKLLAAGASIDALVAQLSTNEIFYNLDKLLAAGATIDVDDLVTKIAKINTDVVIDNLDRLLAAGANPDALAAKIGDFKVIDNLDRLLAAGANPDVLVAQFRPLIISVKLDRYLAAGFSADALMARLEPERIKGKTLDSLLAAGASKEALRAKGIEV